MPLNEDVAIAIAQRLHKYRDPVAQWDVMDIDEKYKYLDVADGAIKAMMNFFYKGGENICRN